MSERNSDRELTFSKEDYLYLAKVYSRCELYEEMVACVKNIISLNQTLTPQERNYFSSAYKNYLSDKRQRHKVISFLLKKQIKNPQEVDLEDTKIALLVELKNSLEKEITQINSEVQSIIDEYLLPNTEKQEDIIFYTKIKADYYRYMYEMEIESKNNEENYLELAEKNYSKALKSSKKNLGNSNFVKLSLMLNYAIFLGEVKGDKEGAIEIAKEAFEAAVQDKNIENEQNKESLVVVQLIQENLILWTGAKVGEEEGDSQRDV